MFAVKLLNTFYDWVVSKKENYLTKKLAKLTWLSPNFWCYLRVMLAVAIVYANNNWIFLSVFLYLVALTTDVIDGVHARATDQVTDEGAKLDANADKVLIGVILLFVGRDVLAGLVISAVFFVDGLLFLTANWLKPFLNQRYGYTLLPGSNQFGKTKMTIQSVAVGLLLFADYSLVIVVICEILLWVATVFAVGSLLMHLYRTKEPPVPDKRIVTWPNVITLSAIFCLLPAGFALAREQWVLASILLAWIFVSDGLDGFIARRYDQKTAFGAVLDPIRDYLARFFVIVWYFIWLDLPVVRSTILAVLMIEILAALVNLYTARKCKNVYLKTKWGEYRAVVHYLVLAIVFFDKIAWLEPYHLSDTGLMGCFFLMFLASLVSLIFYVKQQDSLLSK